MSWRLPEFQCHACGKTFRSYAAEARHRHNFPALCQRNKQFRAFQEEVARSKMPEGVGAESAAVKPGRNGPGQGASQDPHVVAGTADGDVRPVTNTADESSRGSRQL